MNGYVYFIRDTLGHIKIGITKNVGERLNALQTANAMELEYYYGMRVKSMNDASVIERELHEKFQEDRVRGEWFDEKNVIAWLKQPWLEAGNYKFEGVTW